MWLVLWARLVLVRQIATIAAAAAAATAAEAAAAKSVTTAATKSAASVVVVAAGRGHAGRRRCGPRGGQAGCVRHPKDAVPQDLCGAMWAIPAAAAVAAAVAAPKPTTAKQNVHRELHP